MIAFTLRIEVDENKVESGGAALLDLVAVAKGLEEQVPWVTDAWVGVDLSEVAPQLTGVHRHGGP